jgi:O-antigen ligase
VVAAFGRGQHLSRASVAEVVKDSTRSTGSGRRYIWTKTWEQIRQRLWIGYGINAIAVANPDPHHRNPDGSPKDFFDTPHQALLHVMHAVGVLGAACYVAIWAMVLWHSGAWLPAFIAYAAWMMFSWGHLGPENAFWGLAGMAVAHP